MHGVQLHKLVYTKCVVYNCSCYIVMTCTLIFLVIHNHNKSLYAFHNHSSDYIHTQHHFPHKFPKYVHVSLFHVLKKKNLTDYSLIYREPKIHPKVRRRAQKAIKSVARLIDNNDGEEEERKGCLSKLCCTCRKSTQEEDLEEPTKELSKLTPEMEKANEQGWSMIKKVLFPSIPAVLQDLWVYLELFITFAAFTFAMLDLFPISDNIGFNYAYLGLIAFSLILALLDAWVYFFQLGSCARGIHELQNYLKKHRKTASMLENGSEDRDSDDESESEPQGRKCCQFSPKWKHYFSTFFELGRNIASEFILYPLLVFDLFDFIVDEVFRPQDGVAKADFGLFVVGSFYLILAVYIMRIFVVSGSMLSLIRLPKNTKETGNSSDNHLLIKFCLHILGQIVVHFTTIIVIGAKINNENLQFDDGMIFSNETQTSTELGLFMNASTSMNDTAEEGGVNASPFLIVAIVLGGLLPITGIVMFFIVNIYWMREFSVGFWLNMISLLQGESFAETVFGGHSKAVTKDKALKFVEKSQYKKVKKDLQRFKSPSSLTKFLYPTRIPLAALSGLLYDILIVVFIVCLAFTYKDQTVSLAVFKDDPILTKCFVVSLVFTITANIHILLLLNFLLLIFLSIIALAVLIVLFWSPFLLLLYLPVVGILGYILLFREIGTSTKKRSIKKKAPFVKGAHNGGEVKSNEHSVVISNHNDVPKQQESVTNTPKKDSLDKEEIEMLEAYQSFDTTNV